MNIQRIAETLRAAGLCEARQDANDARRRPLYPTAEGQQLADTVARRADDAEQQLCVALGSEHYVALMSELQRLVAHDDPPVA
jgi:DNA-binding MarR family transcriptional regulator